MQDKDRKITFEGYTCKRGLEYAQQEFYEPKRILTTTIRVENGFLPLVPVRTDKPILRDKLGEEHNLYILTRDGLLRVKQKLTE